MPWSAELPLFTRVLPLAIGAAVSPVVLVCQLLNLSSPRRALVRSGAFLLGCTLVVFLWLLCAGWIASLLPMTQRGPDPIAAAFDAMFALVLSALGQRIIKQPRPVEPRPAPEGLMAPALSGLALMGCNLSSLVLFLPAVQDITRAPLAGTAWWAAALLLVLITLLPAWLPPVLVLVLGARGRGVLARLSSWVVPRQRAISASVCFVLALVLALRALLRV
jgi:hypothetical protein